MTLPVLYSLRNCPYAMRARIAIYQSKQVVELRDLVLKDKPAQMIQASPKGTVPILLLACEKVLDESLEIMLWTLAQSDPEDLLHTEVLGHSPDRGKTQAGGQLEDILRLIYRFDHEFKRCLEAYKCAKRYHETNLHECRQACEEFLQDLERRLSLHDYLIDDKESLADIALLPFIRQFARIERQWYLQSPYPQLRRWLNEYLQCAMFTKVMAKYPLWSPDQAPIIFANTARSGRRMRSTPGS
jgi:glutathione S-transferase